jgi:hypothetical protein
MACYLSADNRIILSGATDVPLFYRVMSRARNDLGLDAADQEKLGRLLDGMVKKWDSPDRAYAAIKASFFPSVLTAARRVGRTTLDINEAAFCRLLEATLAGRKPAVTRGGSAH